MKKRKRLTISAKNLEKYAGVRRFPVRRGGGETDLVGVTHGPRLDRGSAASCCRSRR